MDIDELMEALKETGLDPVLLGDFINHDKVDMKDSCKLVITRPDGEVIESTNFVATVKLEDRISSVLNCYGNDWELTQFASALANALNTVLTRVTGRFDSEG